MKVKMKMETKHTQTLTPIRNAKGILIVYIF